MPIVDHYKFKNKFVDMKIKCWVKDVAELAKIAKEEPQFALQTAFTRGTCNRWTYIQLTVSGVTENNSYLQRKQSMITSFQHWWEDQSPLKREQSLPFLSAKGPHSNSSNRI